MNNANPKRPANQLSQVTLWRRGRTKFGHEITVKEYGIGWTAAGSGRRWQERKAFTASSFDGSASHGQSFRTLEEADQYFRDRCAVDLHQSPSLVF